MAPQGRWTWFSLAVALALGGAAACNNVASAPANAPPPPPGDLGKPVARVDDTVITVADVQERINKQAPFVRAKYTALDKKKEFVENLIRFEVMAKEAQKRGYDKDPDVERVMKQQMISKFLQKEFEAKLKVEDVPDADVEKYYKANPDEFNRPDEVRVSQILVKDKAKADKVATEARAASKTDPKPFRDLVTKYSIDEDSKPRGGDLLAIDKNTTTVPRPIVDAAFALKDVGDVSDPIKTDKGYHIIRLTQKRPGFSRPMAEVKRQIQQRLFRDLRTKAMDAFVLDLKKKYNVTIDDANLAKVAVEAGADPHGAPGMPGMPGHGPMPPPAMSVPGMSAAPGAPAMAPPGKPAAPAAPGAKAP